MKVVTVVVAGLVAAALSSCVPSKEKFATMQTVLQGSPKLRASAIEKCSKSQKFMGDQEILAQLMNVPKSQVRPTFCRRYAEAMASGRLKYEDVLKGWSSSPTPNLIKIIQGR